jgi:hypothetical protein
MSALHRDETRGHFVYEMPQFDPVIRSEVIAVDLGPTLHLQVTAAHLTPDDARELAAALTWWADRKRRPEGDDEERLIEACDLLDLIAEATA